MIPSPLIRMGAIALVMTLFLAAMLSGHLDRRANGTEVRLAMTTYDPRDFFLGYYSVLGTDLRVLDTADLAGDDQFAAGEEIFVLLEADSANVWRPVSLHRERPSQGTAIRGRLSTVYDRSERARFGADETDTGLTLYAQFNIERLYNPRQEAQRLDQMLRNGEAEYFLILSIPDDGNAVIKAVELDGERRDFTLF